jgi:hypothetical protein
MKGNLSLPIDMDLSALDFQDYFQCYQQLPEIKNYYTKNNSSIWQMLDDLPLWVHKLSTLVPQDFEHYVCSVINIPPGQTIPLHQDKHYILQKNHGPGDTFRYLVFLEDRKTGHYFEVHDQPMTGWQAGDWIKIPKSAWHLAGNMGIQPFYSAQITVK